MQTHADPPQTPFADFTAPARDRSQVWRLLAGMALIVTVYVGGLVSASALLGLALGPEDALGALGGLQEGQAPGAVVVLLFSFVLLAVGPVLAARLIHGRGAATLFGPGARVRRDFPRAATVILAVWLILLALMWPVQQPAPGLATGRWLLWLVPALAGLAIQTGAEEILFRGYLQQQLAARFRSRWVWMGLPSLGFGLLHFEPSSYGADAWLVVVATGVFGLIAADLTARTGSLGAAWGLHFANNVFAILIMSAEGPLDGLALFTLPVGPDAGLRAYLIFDIVALAGLWWLVRRVLRV